MKGRDRVSSPLRRRSRLRPFIAEAMETRLQLSASFLADLSTASEGISPSEIVTSGTSTYFLANRPRSQATDPLVKAIWRTDGTAAGTLPLVTVASTARSLTPAAGGTIYYTEYVGTTYQVFRFDTASNTTAQAGSVPNLTVGPQNMTAVGSRLFFTANDFGPLGTELYTSDGVTTALVADIRAGSTGSFPTSLTAFGGALYFAADDGVSGIELWKSDGTAAGTSIVKNIDPTFGSAPAELTAVGSTLYFTASDGATGTELWKSDGTSAGTTAVADLWAGVSGSSPASLTAMGSTLFFTAHSPSTGRELYRSDGTAAGTILIADIVAGAGSPSIFSMTVAGTNLLFAATDGTSGVELWRSNGNIGGTARVADIVSGSGSSSPSKPVSVGGNVAVFTATTTAAGTEIWRSDGTAAGTYLLADLRAGTASSGVANLTGSNGVAYFAANKGLDGVELHRTDGTTAGTRQVYNAVGYTVGSNFESMVTAGGLAYVYQAPAGAGGVSGLWRTDGTAAGTFKLHDTARVDSDSEAIGSDYHTPRWTDLGGVLLFANAVDGELWRSDGTVAGTYKVIDINSTISYSGNASVGSFCVINGVAYFGAYDGKRGHELWRTDGTAAGTFMVKDIEPGANNSYPRRLTAVGGTLYFTSEGKLYKSDGSAGGTVMVSDFGTGRMFELTALQNTLMFGATTTSTGEFELWRSDGTAAGTYRVIDLNPGGGSGVQPGWPMAVLGNRLIFAGNNGSSMGLYQTDGTAAGTSLLSPLNASSVSLFRVIDGLVYLTAQSSQLWRTDGTPGGTLLLHTEPMASYPTLQTIGKVGGDVYVFMSDAASGAELWKTDGTVAGTVLAADIFPGPTSSDATNGVLVDGRIIFTAADPSRGTELWKVEVAATTPPTPSALGATALTGGRVQLNWTDVSAGETHYRVERSTSAVFATIDRSVRLAADAVAFLDDVGIQPGVTYHYRVTAWNGLTSSSPATTSAVGLAVPATPGPLTATPVSGARVDLTWTDLASNETSYRVDRSLHSDFRTIDLAVPLPAGAAAYSDITLSPLTRYFYRVVAINGVGDSAPSTAMTVTGDAPPVVQAWGVSPTEISLQWTDNSSTETQFTVVRALTVGGPFTQIGVLPTNTISFTDTSCDEGRQYFYKVIAVAVEGPAAESGVAAAVTIAQQPSNLVADLHTAEVPATNSNPSTMVVVNGVGYFAATDVTHGRELWRTDGTAAGTYRVADIAPGSVSSDPQSLVAMGNTVFFTAFDRDSGREVWKTDGTTAGTVRVREIIAGAAAATITSMTVVAGKLYFAANDGTSGEELWVSDGTTAGTVALDVVAGAGGLSPQQLVDFNGVLYFSGQTSGGGRELWRSDGTLAGTAMVTDIQPGTGSSSPQNFAVWGTRLYFSASVTASGRELWYTDGVSTSMVANINPGSASSTPGSLTAVPGMLVFTADNGTGGRELWKHDGTTTSLLKEVTSGVAGTAFPTFLPTATGFVFLVSGVGQQRTLWRSDGTEAGTVAVTEVISSAAGTTNNTLVLLDGTLYGFGGNASGWHLWRSDGTAAGTEIISGNFLNGTPQSLTAIGTRVVFGADGGVGGRELWSSTGTLASTQRYSDIRIETRDSNPDQLTLFKGNVYFTTDDANGFSYGLWRTDGTAAGTVLIRPGFAFNLTAFGDYLYFTAGTAGIGTQVWRTDGTAAGTSMFADPNPGVSGVSANIRSLVAATSRLFFTVAVAGQQTYDLWATDGTAAAYKVTTTPVYYHDANPVYRSAPVAVGDTVYFTGMVTTAGGTGQELWKSDGTSAGTTIVKDLEPGTGNSTPFDVTSFGGMIYFAARTNATGMALWKSDGTDAGTSLVYDIHDGNQVPAIAGLTASGNYLYFSADHPSIGYEAWRTDGTTAGTVPVADTSPGMAHGFPFEFTRAGNATYFMASAGGVHSLWRIDDAATAATAIRVLSSSTLYPRAMFGVGQTLFYYDRGFLWRSDGTRAGTVQVTQVHNIGLGNGVTNGRTALAVGDTLYFRGYEPKFGRELRTVVATLPAAPTGLTVGASGFGNGAGTGSSPAGNRVLSWQDNAANEAGFVVQRSDDPTFTLISRTFFVDANSTGYVDATASDGVTWYYRVQAVNAGGGSAFTGAVTVSPPPPPVSIVSWQIAATHGAAGEAALVVPDDGSFVEPRVSGVRTLLVTFDAPINPASLTAAGVGVWGNDVNNQPVNLSAITPTFSMRGGDTVAVITFNQPLPDYARYLIRLTGVTGANGVAVAGDNDRILTALLGDATGDRRTNNTDVGAVTSLRGINPINPATVNEVRSDMTNDGRINNSDVGGASSVRGKDARFIADPVPPSGGGAVAARAGGVTSENTFASSVGRAPVRLGNAAATPGNGAAASGTRATTAGNAAATPGARAPNRPALMTSAGAVPYAPTLARLVITDTGDGRTRFDDISNAAVVVNLL